MATTHLIALRSTATICGIPRTKAKGNVTTMRSETDCASCRKANYLGQPGIVHLPFALVQRVPTNRKPAMRKVSSIPKFPGER